MKISAKKLRSSGALLSNLDAVVNEVADQAVVERQSGWHLIFLPSRVLVAIANRCSFDAPHPWSSTWNAPYQGNSEYLSPALTSLPDRPPRPSQLPEEHEKNGGFATTPQMASLENMLFTRTP